MSTGEAQQNEGERTASRRTSRAKTRVVSARVDPETYGLVEVVAREHGITVSRAAELMLRRHKPIKADSATAAAVADRVRPALEAAQAEYAKATGQLQRIGSNLNQLVKRLNAGQVQDSEVRGLLLDIQRRIVSEIEAAEQSMSAPLERIEDMLREAGRG